MKNLWRQTALILSLAWALSPAQTSAQVDLDQNWTADEKDRFWFTDQGSRIVPYKWFLHLPRADSPALFRDDANIERIRYIPTGPSPRNPDGLPIGFVKTEQKTGGEHWMGFTCAACHTGKVEYRGQSMLIEGAPAMADYTLFVNELIAAVEATANDQAKFTAFAQKVMGEKYKKSKEGKLKKRLNSVLRNRG